MPRGLKSDLAGLIQHVMARGIESRNVFEDIRDREVFLERLSETLRRRQADTVGSVWVCPGADSERFARATTLSSPMGGLRANEETGKSMAALGRYCGVAHTTVREAI